MDQSLVPEAGSSRNLRKIPQLRWAIAALLFLATVIAYVDLQSLSVVAPTLHKDLHISDVEYSNILEAYLVASMCIMPLTGVIVDKLGNRISLALFVAWWSIANALHAVARNATELEVFRFLFGVGQTGVWNADEKAISEWYPPSERATIAGIVINAGASVGAIVAPPLVAGIAVSLGWRAAFEATAGLGLFWLLPWLFIYHVPEKHPRITRKEYEHINESQLNHRETPNLDSRAGRSRWVDLLKVRQTWGLFTARIFSDPVWWFYLFWLPSILRIFAVSPWWELAPSHGFPI